LLDVPEVDAPRVFHANVNERGQPNQSKAAVTLPPRRHKGGSHGRAALLKLIWVIDIFRSLYKIEIIQMFVVVYK